jgi:hypothetical protein
MKNLKVKALSWSLFVVYIVSWAVIAIVSGKGVTDLWSAAIIAYKSVPVVVAIATLFVLYGWRWKVFHPWLVPFPDLNGTWQGTIQTTWKNPETGEVPGPIPTILTIKQSFARISCVMRTAEMVSRSFLADFWLDQGEQIRKLGYSYVSTPLPTVTDRSPPHCGTMVFEIVGTPATKLRGIYWTERKTTGEITLAFRERRLLEEMPDDAAPHPVSGKK